MQSFLTKYSNQLDNYDTHLNYEVLARYINNYKNLSKKEIIFIESHLAKCVECSKKFYEVFDEDIESDENNYNIKFNQLKNFGNEEDIIHFYNDETKIHLTLKKNNNENIIINFNEVPQKFLCKQIKCSISENDINLRIISLEENKNYSVKVTESFDLNSIQEINSEMLIKSKGEYLNQNIFSMKKYIPYSIAASILIMLGVIFYFLNKSETNNKLLRPNQIAIDSSQEKIERESTEKSESPKTEPKIIEEKEISINKDFASNDFLENFIQRNVRSEENIKIIIPKNSDTLGIPILFKWENEKEANIFNLIIVNNKNETVWNMNTSMNEIEFNEKLKPGLYYWKLEMDNEMQYVGRFFIK